MILKGSQRGGAKQLALHLLNAEQNEHVELHSLRGFVANDLQGALREIYAVSRGTKCQQFMFSLSLSPPQNERVPVAVFESAIKEIEDRLGLTGQPRAVVFHEKEARRHAHCVWSRIDPASMTAIPLPHFKLKLRDLSRQLYIEHGWRMPLGLVTSSERNPLNFSLEEWQQAKRAERNPKDIKAIFQDCWAISDNATSFSQALAARGFYLAQGDRRGFVALDHQGEVYSLSRWCGVKTKELSSRLGDGSGLPSVAQTKERIAHGMAEMFRHHLDETRAAHEQKRKALEQQRRELVLRQRLERQDLRERQAFQAVQAAKQRAQSLPRGLRAIWSWVTGSYKKLVAAAEKEAALEQETARAARQMQIDQQFAERQKLQQQIRSLQHQETIARERIYGDAQEHQDILTRKDIQEDREKTPTMKRKLRSTLGFRS